MEYHVVDVFAERPLEGNPLTVFPNAGALDAEAMQAIARETNHSETTFVTGHAADGTPQVRIFTPQAELRFAGHPTLGTAHILGAEALDLQVGRIPVSREANLLWMAQKPASFGLKLDLRMLEDALGVAPMGAEVASTGTPVGLVQVANSKDVRDADLEARHYDGPEVAGLYVFASHSDHDVHARFFADFVGIHEDPATGGAAGPLCALLHKRGELTRGQTRVISQGLEMHRPSKLHIRFDETTGSPNVGGQVQEVARGTWLT